MEEYNGIEYFKDEELWCPCCHTLDFSQSLCNLLYRAREIYGRPIQVTSGFRCITHNTNVGGKLNSSHRRGLAVDIACPTSRQRHELIKIFLSLGITRIGIGEKFIHIDTDTTKDQNVIWLYKRERKHA